MKMGFSSRCKSLSKPLTVSTAVGDAEIDNLGDCGLDMSGEPAGSGLSTDTGGDDGGAIFTAV
jgi:hypothetical protein